MAARHRVVLLPGAVLPAEPAYAALLQVLGERVHAVAKDLEVYADDQPPLGFNLGVEAAGVLREADVHGFDRFHLVGYSGGGASALALAALHGERLLSLALLEPAWAGNERTQQEEELMERFRALDSLPPSQFMAEFTRLQLAPGVEPPAPPEGPPPPWMAKRPAGIRAFLDAFDAGDLDIEALKAFTSRCISRSAVAATRISYGRWETGCRGSSPISHSRRSRTPPLRPATPRGARAPGQLATRTLAPRQLLSAPLVRATFPNARPARGTDVDPTYPVGTGDLCDPRQWPRGASTDGQRRHRGGVA